MGTGAADASDAAAARVAARESHAVPHQINGSRQWPAVTGTIGDDVIPNRNLILRAEQGLLMGWS